MTDDAWPTPCPESGIEPVSSLAHRLQRMMVEPFLTSQMDCLLLFRREDVPAVTRERSKNARCSTMRECAPGVVLESFMAMLFFSVATFISAIASRVLGHQSWPVRSILQA